MTNSCPIILAVDDDPNDLLFLCAAFKFIGGPTNIHSVGGGDEAVAYLNGEGVYSDRTLHPYPDCILTDLKMPGLDGFGVLEALKKKPQFALIRAVVLSGSQDADDIKKAYWLGASGYLVKPSSPVDLRKMVKVLHDFWMLCERPERNEAGGQGPPSGCHKLGGHVTGDISGSARGCGR